MLRPAQNPTISQGVWRQSFPVLPHHLSCDAIHSFIHLCVHCFLSTYSDQSYFRHWGHSLDQDAPGPAFEGLTMLGERQSVNSL